MQSGEPSRTAFAAAMHRAAHQVVERGAIFFDPLAVTILGRDAEELAREAEANPSRRGMRMFIAVRTRFAEDALAAAVDRGVSQLVVLGAGLDTYAYRGTLDARLRVFEVDHPATQAWKRERLAQMGIAIPDALQFAPVDFERETLQAGLAAAAFDPTHQTFFTWLGVVPYLTEDAIWSTLRFIADLRGGAHVVFDYSDPPALLSPELREAHEQRAARVASVGEAFLSFFDADDLRARLMETGFGEVEDIGPREITARYFPGFTGPARDRGGHVVRASTNRIGR